MPGPVLVSGHSGEQDRQWSMCSAGGHREETSKRMNEQEQCAYDGADQCWEVNQMAQCGRHLGGWLLFGRTRR